MGRPSSMGNHRTAPGGRREYSRTQKEAQRIRLKALTHDNWTTTIQPCLATLVDTSTMRENSASGCAKPARGQAFLSANSRSQVAQTRISLALECPRFGGHLSAWSALSGWAGRMRRYAKGIELSQAVPAGVPA
jgi:hypothetical protein